MPVKIAIIAALEREIAPLVRGWRVLDGVAAAYRSFERDGVLVVCAGIGAAAARRSAESVLSQYRPQLFISAGIAGGLSQEAAVGKVYIPEAVVDAATGRRFPIIGGRRLLVSASGVLSIDTKRRLASEYGAQIVDMEAAAVAEVAQSHGVRFRAVKAVSDPHDFAMPDMRPFIDGVGRFRTAQFVAHAAIHPVQWGTVRLLARNTAIASQELCSVIKNLIIEGDWLDERSDYDQSAITRGETRTQ